MASTYNDTNKAETVLLYVNYESMPGLVYNSQGTITVDEVTTLEQQGEIRYKSSQHHPKHSVDTFAADAQ
jgi:hypothetical protein